MSYLAQNGNSDDCVCQTIYECRETVNIYFCINTKLGLS